MKKNKSGSTRKSDKKESQKNAGADIQYQLTEGEYIDFFENAPIGLHWLSADGTILKVNRAELDMLGYTREEYVGRNIREFYVDEEAIDEIMQNLRSGEEMRNYEGRMECKDGTLRYVTVSSNVYRENGKFVHTRCFTRDITELKQREDRLQESQNRYRTLVESFPKGAVGLFDKEFKYTAIGGELVTSLGLTPEDRIGRRIFEIYPDEIVDKIKPHFEAVLKGESNAFEIDYRNRHLFAETVPIKDNEGNVSSGMLVVQDITERWKTRQELRKSEARFRMMTENLNEVIWMTDVDSEEILYINPAFEQVWGISREKILEKPMSFIETIHPQDRERVRERYPILSEFEDEYRIIRPDGEIRWIYARGSVINDEEGVMTRVLGVGEDITKRKHAEQQLLKSRNRLRKALDIDTVGVLFWDAEEINLVEANDAFLEMGGYSHEEVIGKSWRDFTPEEFHPKSKKAIEDLNTSGCTQPYEKQYIRKDGSRWWGLFAPRKIDENEAVEFVLDISDRKKAEQELEALNETLEERVESRTKKLRSYQKQLQFLATQLSKAEERERQRLATELHDRLGQMLAVAKMKVEALKRGNKLHEEDSGVGDLKKVIDDALKYSHNLMVELKPPPVLDKEDVTKVLHWTVQNMEKQGLKIEFEDNGESLPVEKELRTVIYQSARELLQNILKHAGTDKARMTIARDMGNLKITIEDKGDGFGAKHLQPAPDEGGGFGLFNIRERMDWYGGYFEIYSEPGKGTKAELFAPLKKVDQKEKSAHKEIFVPHRKKELVKNRSEKINVLLVDDHEMVRKGLRNLIEDQDDMFILGEASQGEEAIELAKKTSPDVIVMDVDMPVMDGIEATQQIKSEMPQVRVIGLSLHENVEVNRNMESAGASAYLTKSEAVELLVSTIRAESSDALQE